jgi:hypothetical protein
MVVDEDDFSSMRFSRPKSELSVEDCSVTVVDEDEVVPDGLASKEISMPRSDLAFRRCGVACDDGEEDVDSETAPLKSERAVKAVNVKRYENFILLVGMI